MTGKSVLKGLVTPERILKPAMISIGFKGRLNQSNKSKKGGLMLNFGAKCEAKNFIGGKVKRMMGLSKSPVRNHWLIDVGHGVALQSYDSIVAFKFTKRFGKFDKGDVLLDRCTWNCSATTARYRRIFLDESIDETRENITSEKYTLEALNFVHTFDNLIRPVDFY